jgi:hypothetical protein
MPASASARREKNMIFDRLVRGLRLAGAGGLLVIVTGCGPGLSPTGAVAISPVPAQQARIWFYRDQNPNDPMGTPYLRVDGAIAAASVPGGASYRDVAAGRHQISVESYVNDGNQAKIVDLPPGAQLYARVVPLDNYEEGGGEFGGGYHRDNYYLWLYPAEAAWPAIARSAFYGGGSTLTAAMPAR